MPPLPLGTADFPQARHGPAPPHPISSAIPPPPLEPRNMKKLLLTLVLLALAATALPAFDNTAFQLGLWSPKLQLVPPEITISGLKLNLPYGSNCQITGLDLGLVSITREQGAELEARVAALQVNLFNSNSGSFSGLQAGLVNLSDTSCGIVLGAVNSTNGKASGIHCGLVNTSLEFRGLEVGLVNYTEFLEGIQIGLINIATKSTIPFLPIVNVCF